MRNQTTAYINKCPIFSHAVGRKGCTKQRREKQTWMWTKKFSKIIVCGSKNRENKNKIKHNPEVNNQEILCLDISTCPQSIAYSSPFPFSSSLALFWEPREDVREYRPKSVRLCSALEAYSWGVCMFRIVA